MPTRGGWLLLTGALLAAGVGRLIAIPELFEIGAAGAVLFSGALVIVNMKRHRLLAARRLRPIRIHAGNTTRVEMRIANPSRTTTEPINYVETLGPELGGNRRFGIMPIQGNGHRDVTFDIQPARRGIYQVGPSDIWFTDPFGMARKSLDPVGPSHLIVYPMIEDLGSPTPHSDSHHGQRARMMVPAQRGGEFFTMREYQWGDDLRKIHWASTARTGKLMIRQEELHSETAAMVLLDDRDLELPHSLQEAAFDKLTSSAASVLNHFHKRGVAYGLALASDASDGALPSLLSRGDDHLHSLLERLAVARTARMADPAAAVLAMRRTKKASGIVVLVTTDLSSGIAAFGQSGRDNQGERILIVHPLQSFLPKTRDPASGASLHRLATIGLHRGYRILISDSNSLAETWNREFERRIEARSR